MNYSGNEALRQDIALLNKAANELHQQCLVLERKCRWSRDDDLSKLLAGQLLCQTTSLSHELSRRIGEIDTIFSD